MNVNGKVAVVTGAASGIGRALARKLADEGARGVVLADLDGEGVRNAASEIGPQALPVTCDVTDEAELDTLISSAERHFGPVDLFFSNAGILGDSGGLDAPDDTWRQVLDVNLYAHVHAARRLVPGWTRRGGGYLVITASAAGLVTQLGAAPYSVSKHAVVALAEWLAITYGDQGVKVSCICPMYVNTPMLGGGIEAVQAAGGVLEPEDVANATLAGIRDERFLILPHPEVLTFFRRKADDYDRWLNGMRRLQATLLPDGD